MTASSPRRAIDGKQAQHLFERLGSWAAVAKALRQTDGPAFTIGSLARAAHLWRKANNVSSRHARGPYDSSGGGLGVFWRPPLPRKLHVVPCYRTNTARPA